MRLKFVQFLMLILLSANAFADNPDPVVVNDFPANKIMQANYIYKKAAVFENLGTYNGIVYAIEVYEDTVYNCRPGYYLPHESESCVLCPKNSYCVGGEYTYSEEIDQGITYCPEGLSSPAGMWEAAQCGYKLHIGDDVIYSRSVKKTNPSLSLDTNNDGVADYFINTATPANLPMNNKTERKLKIKYNDNVYSVYDDSVEVE